MPRLWQKGMVIIMKNQFLEIARFSKPQGLKGDIRARLFCDSPEIFEKVNRFYLGEEKSFINLQLRETRKGFVILKAEGVNTIEDAERLIGRSLYINRDDYPLGHNTWFIADIIGLTVVNADSGEVYGKVVEILQNAPKDVYVIKGENGKERLFPAIPEVLIDVDVTAGIIKIRPLEGLFDEHEN